MQTRWSLSFGSYGISTWISVLFLNIGFDNPYAETFVFALACLPGNLVATLFMDRLGRQSLLRWGLLLAALAALGFACGTGSPAVVVSCACLFNGCTVLSWNSLDVLSVEAYPTGVRSLGMGFLAASGRVGAVFAQVVNGRLEKNVAALLLSTTLCLGLGLVASLGLSETRVVLSPENVGYGLPEGGGESIELDLKGQPMETDSKGHYENLRATEILEMHEHGTISNHSS